MILDKIKKDAEEFFDIRGVKDKPVQCGTAHAIFCKWLLYRHGIRSDFWSIAEKDLPSHYPSSKGIDDESFLLFNIDDKEYLVDICATPEIGPYVGENIYDLTKAYKWEIEIHIYKKREYKNLDEFCGDLHHIDLSTPEELKEYYPLTYRGS